MLKISVNAQNKVFSKVLKKLPPPLVLMGLCPCVGRFSYAFLNSLFIARSLIAYFPIPYSSILFRFLLFY